MIEIDRWPNSTFIRVDGKRPDQWFMRYTEGEEPPRFQMPMVCDGFQEMPFIPKLWVMSKSGRQERKVRRWFLALHFDKRNHYHH